MRSSLRRIAYLIVVVLALLMTAEADDLKIRNKISVSGSNFSSETYVKGARERNVASLPGGLGSVSIRQCDLKRTLTLNDQTQTYLVAPEPESDDVNDAAALLVGAPASQSGGKITVTSTVTDTGERKPMFGYQAKHLKTTVLTESSPNSCSPVHQKFEIDGWYADLGKELAGCAPLAPPIHQSENCHDRVVVRSKGTAKPGFALAENVTVHNGDAQSVTMNVEVEDISRQTLAAELFDVPASYREVNSLTEMYGMQGTQTPAPTAQLAPGGGSRASASTLGMMNPAAFAQAAALGMRPGMPGIPGMPGAAPAGGAPASVPQVLGPKAPGKVRIGVVSPEAQVGQGSNSGMDYGTPIRNAMIQFMNGPAVEVAALASHIQMQVQAEAQQKQCDYVLYSSITVKHGSGGGFGKFMKMAGPATSMVPMVGAMKGMGAAATASIATSAVAQTAAMSSLANFNGQIKPKDDVTMTYQLVAAGQQSPKLSDTLKAKASSDGQDVLTPLIQQLANTVLTEAAKK